MGANDQLDQSPTQTRRAPDLQPPCAQEEADGTLTPENPSILELEAKADRMAVGEEAQAVRDFQRRLDYNMRKVRCSPPRVTGPAAQ